MNINDVTRLICQISLAAGAFFLTAALSGGWAMLLGIFFVGFAIMTAARYPYRD